MSNEDIQKKIGDHWSNVTAKKVLSNWWEVPAVLRHINKKVCGRPIDGFSAGLTSRAFELAENAVPFKRGISVGCGFASKEMALIEQGLVDQFDLFELSEVRIAEGRKKAEEKGISDRVHFYRKDAFEVITEESCYDFVHWNNSLHHMLDVDEAVRWSHRILCSGGMFYMDDFIGPNRLQWTPRMLQEANRVRESIPQKYLQHPTIPGAQYQIKIDKPNREALMNQDPSEAADSERIMESVQRYFPHAEIKFTGGVIYHPGLGGLYHQLLSDSEGEELLERLLMIDDRCSDRGDNHYGTALAIKP